MTIQVLGISGSPIEDSNTDRVIRAMLDATGLKSEFVKLSRIHVRPCMACKQCVSDNICKVQDDFPALAEKIKKADALIIGAYLPYKQIDGFTKALLERLWSLRHLTNLLGGKLCATVLTHLTEDAGESVRQSLATQLGEMENMEILGQVMLKGNLPCFTCGVGDECEMSGIQRRYGSQACSANYEYSRAEDQKDAYDEAIRIARQIGQRIRAAK
jgi:multimeric flavodoxin WrbA